MISYDDIFKPDNFKELLKTMTRQYHYSLFNQLLIFNQYPDNHIVAGQQAWTKLGATVNTDAKGISVIKYDKDFNQKIVLVFDQEQTDYTSKKPEYDIDNLVKNDLQYAITYDPNLKIPYMVIEENEEIIVKDDDMANSNILSAYIDIILIDENFRDKCLKKCIDYCLNFYFGYNKKESFIFVSSIEDKKEFLEDIHEEILTVLSNLIGSYLSFEEVNLFNLFAVPDREEFIHILDDFHIEDETVNDLAAKLLSMTDKDYKELYEQLPLMSYPLTLIKI